MSGLKIENLAYNHIIGTGGIGSGMFFSMEDNHTLGRNESRLAKLEPFKDYCKQHIILHYVSVLTGAGKSSPFHILPIGKVGNDEIGQQLIKMMRNAGMQTENIEACKDLSTLFSVCYQYPDHSGGNITTANSASSQVKPTDITKFFTMYSLRGQSGIALAVPEVPIETRVTLLEKGKKHKLLNVASVLSSEVAEFNKLKGFELTDVLAINIDEAQMIAGIEGDQPESKLVIEKCTKKLSHINKKMIVLITDGSKGAYCFQDGKLEFTPSLKTEVISTAGAGDAFLAGVIVGLCSNLPIQRGYAIETLQTSTITTAVELGTLLASYSVTSADTIHMRANAESLSEYAKQNELKLGSDFQKLFDVSNNHSNV